MSRKEYLVLKGILAVSLCAAGLFYEFTACICAGLLGILWWHIMIDKRSARIFINEISVGFFLLVLMYLITCIYGVDGGMGMIGFFQMLSVLFFLLCAMELSPGERVELLGLVPLLGVLMTAIGVALYAARGALPGVYQFFYTADRFGGFFQYANVYAMFCLLGIILTLGQEEEKPLFLKWGAALVLAFGILLSGSRSVAALLLFVLILTAVRRRDLRLPAIALLLLIAVGVAVYVNVTGNRQNIGRLLTSSLSSSTLLGRILYWKDGLRLLRSHPFGLGYLGYYYMEGSVQTGVYEIRYIHNELLQLALDVGVLPSAIFLVLLIKGIVSARGEMRFSDGCLMAVMLLHSLFDFDMEFTAMWFVLILALGLRRGKEYEPARTGKKACQALAVIAALVCLYAGLAMTGKHAGDAALTAGLLPFDTEAQTELLRNETDAEIAEALADKIIRQNAYVAEGYDIQAVLAYQKGDYREMERAKMQSVLLQKYDTEIYNRYVLLLGRGIFDSLQEGDAQTAEYLTDQAFGIKERIAAVLDETDPLAYEIRDVPKLELSAEVEQYLRELDIMKEEWMKAEQEDSGQTDLE